MEAALDFLTHPKSAACLEIDPTGDARLVYAKKMRRHMKRMFRRKVLKEKIAAKFIDLIKERLAIGLYRPNLVLPNIADFLLK